MMNREVLTVAVSFFRIEFPDVAKVGIECFSFAK